MPHSWGPLKYMPRSPAIANALSKLCRASSKSFARIASRERTNQAMASKCGLPMARAMSSPAQKLAASARNSGRQLERFVCCFHRATHIHQIQRRPAEHLRIRRLDAQKTLLPGQCKALADQFVAGANPAFGVSGVADAARRCGFGLGRSGLAGECQRIFKGMLAFDDAPDREQQVAAQFVQARQFQRQTGLLGQRLRLRQQRQPSSGRSTIRMPEAMVKSPNACSAPRRAAFTATAPALVASAERPISSSNRERASLSGKVGCRFSACRSPLSTSSSACA